MLEIWLDIEHRLDLIYREVLPYRLLRQEFILKAPFFLPRSVCRFLDQPVCLYDVGGIGDPYQVFLPEKKEVPMTRLNSPLPIECFLLEGKTVSDTAISGHITRLGENTAEGSLDAKVDVYANLRILLAAQDAVGSAELYAKVLPIEDSEAGPEDKGIRLQFTSMPPETKNYIEQMLSDG